MEHGIAELAVAQEHVVPAIAVADEDLSGVVEVPLGAPQRSSRGNGDAGPALQIGAGRDVDPAIGVGFEGAGCGLRGREASGEQEAERQGDQ